MDSMCFAAPELTHIYLSCLRERSSLECGYLNNAIDEGKEFSNGRPAHIIRAFKVPRLRHSQPLNKWSVTSVIAKLH